MYGILSEMSVRITEPVTRMIDSFANYPLVVALLLGVIGAAAPCQLTGNVSAMTIYGNRSVQKQADWKEVLFFIAGKVVVFSVFGLFAWMLGQRFETVMLAYFPFFRKVMGPLIVLTGLVLLGVLTIPLLHRLSIQVPRQLRDGKVGSFLLGASFSLAFCPTMFILFFGWLMPIVSTTSYGLALPAVFGIATAFPLILLVAFIWFFDVDQRMMRKSVKIGRVIQKSAGVLLILIGLLDTVTYWS